MKTKIIALCIAFMFVLSITLVSAATSTPSPFTFPGSGSTVGMPSGPIPTMLIPPVAKTKMNTKKNPTPIPRYAVGDITRDHQVNILDMQELYQVFFYQGRYDLCGDMNLDNQLNVIDALLLAQYFAGTRALPSAFCY
ncbi:hypothetical protein J4410_06035 [Candidatus Woesearchaeota archaeon]|nr:hypothetical protein [Candidatus Woesearchaeota archaeon]